MIDVNFAQTFKCTKARKGSEMRMLARLARILSSAVLAIYVATFQARATSFPATGGDGDVSQYYGCPAGKVMVGLYGRLDVEQDQLGLICAEFSPPDFEKESVSREAPRGTGTGIPLERQCSGNSAVRYLEFHLLGEDDPLHSIVRWRYISKIYFLCFQPKNGSPVDSGETFLSRPPTDLRRVTGAVHECQGNEYAVGINIRYGARINAIGLVCKDITPPVEPQPGQTTGGAAPYGAIGEKFAKLGGHAGALGQPASPEGQAPHGGRCQAFQHGMICWHPQIGEAFGVWGSIHDKWAELGRAEFGYPITDERATADGRGRYNHFRGMQYPNRPESSIFWSPQTGAHAIYGAIRDEWAKQGWERGTLGYPTSDEHQDGKYRRVNFERGVIKWAPDSGIETMKNY